MIAQPAASATLYHQATWRLATATAWCRSHSGWSEPAMLKIERKLVQEDNWSHAFDAGQDQHHA